MIDDTQPPAEQMPGTIGRYQTQECVGFGAMGAVYKAFDPLIKRTLAIKTIRLDVPKNSPQYRSFIDRFYHEARISGTLNHPNIVTLFDIGEEGGVPFLAMEYVAGETIALILERGERFNPERVVGLVSQIASAIDYAHGRGVVHRDIKPSNLILSERDRVKVTDFGIAKMVDTDMTQSGQLLGTPSYMSPEQAMGEKLDGRSDIFSLGVCAFEMLSGEQPFPGANVTSILYKLVHVDPIEPENLEMNGLVPDKWRQVFNKVLAKKPDDRYQTAAEFVQDLEYCLGSWFGAAMGEETIALPGKTGVEEEAAPGGTATLAAPPLPAVSAARPGIVVPVDAEDDLPPTLAASVAQARESDRTETAELPAVHAPAAESGLATPPARIVSPAPAAVVAEPANEEATILMGAAPAVPENVEATVLMAGPGASVGESPETVLMPSRPRQGVTPAPDSGTLRATPVPGRVVTPAPGGARRRPTATPPPLPTVAVVSGGEAPRPASRPAGSPATPPPGKARRPAPSVSPLLVWVGVGVFTLCAVGVGLVALSKIRGRGDGSAAVAAPSPAGKVSVASPTAAPAVTEGFLHVTTQPSGATVTINGEPRGASPVELRLSLGLYDVQVALSGYETQARTVEITASKPVANLDVSLGRVAAVASGSLDVRSKPSGAEVSVDGKPSGQTPIRGLELVPGARRVDIAKEGYASARRNVVARAGKHETIAVELAAVPARPTPRPAPVAEAVDPNRVFLSREVDTPPKKLSGDTPDSAGVPRPQRGQKVSVTVEFVVTESGEVGSVEITESEAGEKFNDVVVKTLRKWRFEPGVKAGVKVKVRETRKFTYQFG